MMLKGQEIEGRFFEIELETLINKEDPLIKLSEVINWENYEKEFKEHYNLSNGRPGVSIRALTGVLLLKYLNGLSDLEVMNNFIKIPSWQYFCGYRYFIKDKAPFERSLLSIFRKRIGTKGAEIIFKSSIDLSIKLGVLKKKDIEKVHVDTTVQEKNIAHPNDANLLKKSILRLGKKAKKERLKLKQSYKRVCKRLSIKASRYANAKQFKRVKKTVKELSTKAGRLVREIEDKIKGNKYLEDYFKSEIELVNKIRYQSTNSVASKDRLYSLHEQHVECISKGKAHKKYEFGNKVTITITDKNRIIVDCEVLTGNPHDSKTLKPAIDNVEKKFDTKTKLIGVDLGYRGSNVKEAVHNKMKKLSNKVKRFIKSHPKIESVISHSKRKFLLGLSRLKGLMGDQVNALMSATAYNLSVLMRKSFS